MSTSHVRKHREHVSQAVGAANTWECGSNTGCMSPVLMYRRRRPVLDGKWLLNLEMLTVKFHEKSLSVFRA